MREENSSAGDALAAPRPRKQLTNERQHSHSGTVIEAGAGEAEEEDEDTAMYQLRPTGDDEDDDDDDEEDEEAYEAEHALRQVGHLGQSGGARSPESSLSSRTATVLGSEAARMAGRGKHGNIKSAEMANSTAARGVAGNRKARPQPPPPTAVARKSPPPPTGAGHPALATTTLGGFPIPMPDRQLSEDQGSHSSTNWGSDGDEEETDAGAWPSAGRKRPNGGARGTDSGDEPRSRKHPRSSSNDDDDTEDQNVRTGRKKAAGPMECSVEGCTKKSRGSSGLCRSHGGGEKCVVEGCRGFARLDGRCCMHGGAQMCNVQGCQRRARFFGRCTMHGGYVNCKEEGCTLRAVGKGKCAKHGGKDHCKHPGCCRPRLKSRDDWCYTHYTHVERFREQLVGERLRGFPVVQCGYFELATSEQCAETGLSRSGLCPEHLTYSLCGDAASCQKRAQVKGRCLEHAHEPQCQQFDCYRRAEVNQPMCREHDSWRFQCVRQGCPGRTFTADMLCPAHDKGLLRPDESQLPPMPGLGVSTETLRMKAPPGTGVPAPPLGPPSLSRRGSGRKDMSGSAPVAPMAYDAQQPPVIVAQQQAHHSPRANAAVLDWQAERGSYHPHHNHHLQNSMPLQRLLQAAKEREGSENSLEGMVPSHITDPSHPHGLSPAPPPPVPGPGQLSPNHMGPGSYRTSTTTTTTTSSTSKLHPSPSVPLMEFLGGGLMVGPPPGSSPPPELAHPLIYSVPSGHHHHPHKPVQHHPHHVPHHHSARQPSGAMASSHSANAPAPYPMPLPVPLMGSAGLPLPGHMAPMAYAMSPVPASSPLHHHPHPSAYGRYYVQQQQQQQQMAASAGRDYMTHQQHQQQQAQQQAQHQHHHHQQQQAASQGLAVRTLDRVAIGSSQPQQSTYQISQYSSAN